MHHRLQPVTLKVTVSGSFRRHLTRIQHAVQELSEMGCTVLSPADPRIVDAFGDFVFVSSDVRRSIKGVQNRHLAAIEASDFLWLVSPDGYVGQSAAMELGYAAAKGVPVFCDVTPSDWTLRQYVTPVGSLVAAVTAVARGDQQPATEGSLLVDPQATVAQAHRELEFVERTLTHDRERTEVDPADAPLKRIERLLAFPGRDR